MPEAMQTLQSSFVKKAPVALPIQGELVVLRFEVFH